MADDSTVARYHETAARIRDAHRRKAANDIALLLINETGSATADQVAARLAADYKPLTDQQVADMVAAKAQSAAGRHRARHEQIVAQPDRIRAKVNRLQRLLDDVRADLEAACQQAADAAYERAAADAEELLAHAVSRGGQPGRTSPGRTAANARPASAAGRGR